MWPLLGRLLALAREAAAAAAAARHMAPSTSQDGPGEAAGRGRMGEIQEYCRAQARG